MKKTTKKTTYYAVICPVCGWKAVGNWLIKQKEQYYHHLFKEHPQPKPYIKKERR